MARHYTSGNIKHTGNFDDKYHKGFATRFSQFDTDELEPEVAKAKAKAQTVIIGELRLVELIKIRERLAQLVEVDDIPYFSNTTAFEVHLSKVESDFERFYSSKVNDVTRQEIMNYTYKLVSSIIETNTLSPLALRLTKRLAIRLGMTDLINHI